MPDSQPDTSTTPDTQSAAQAAAHNTPGSQPGAQAQQSFFEGAGFPDDIAASGGTDAATGDTESSEPGTHKPPSSREFSLKIVASKSGSPLGKAQKTFNRLIGQIENLRNEIAKERRRLDNALQYHAQILHPLHRRIAARRGQIVVFAHALLKTAHRAFSQKLRRTLRMFISSQLEQIIPVEGGLADEKLQAIYADIEGMTLDETRRRQHDAEREEIEADMADLGVDIDLSALHNAKTPEEIARALADLTEQFKKAGLDEDSIPPDLRPFFGNFADKSGGDAGGGSASAASASASASAPDAKTRKKSKKQLAREVREKAIEEARARSLSSIYKQLARVFHPDLEPDPARKKQKEALMQQLTVAYRANDMHTLLRLELEWLQHGEQDIERLSEEKLAIYNEVLREQVEALQDERFMISGDPRYAPLRPYAQGMFGSLASFNGAKEELALTNTLKLLGSLDTNATGADAIKQLKAVLRDFSAEMSDFAREQAIDAMMAGMMEDAMEDMMDNRRGRGRGGRGRRGFPDW